ncbi:peptide ABC transporter substrate-binding protein [Thermoflavimicrobium daqui]|uniref:peptide ABC transporter substrate-binding protein n=1 Tax=Thermoflavimicrobium daqui TaxID=2137476 RepID=UPI00143DE900|nr:peptide ABC transporter substrate-binding protein [Thermoflavimicrobium daqui]
MNYWQKSLLYVIIFSLFLTGCDWKTRLNFDLRKEVVEGQVLRMTEPQIDSQLDPAKVNELSSLNILNQIQESLLRLGKDHRPEPAMAAEFQVSQDGLTYIFFLRKDAKWSDGKAVTAYDFEFAWKRLLHPKNKSPYANVLFGIKHARAYYEGKAKEAEVGIFAMDEKTLKIQLNHPDRNFLDKVVLPVLAPQRKDMIQKYKTNFATSSNTMVYNGPFILITFTPSKLVLLKNDAYWDRSNVGLKMAEIFVVKDQTKERELYHQGQLDIARVQQTSKDEKSSEYLQTEMAQSDYLLMNLKKPLFQNDHIRQAITLAIDRKNITEQLNDGSKPASGLIPSAIVASGGHSYRDIRLDSLVIYNPKKAQEQLRLGKSKLKSKLPTSLHLLVPDDERKKAAIQIKKQLKKTLGLEVLLSTVEVDQLKDLKRKGNYDLILDSFIANSNSPSDFLDRWYNDFEENGNLIQSSTLHELFKLTKQANNEEQKLTYLTRIEKLLVKPDQLAMVHPLYDHGETFLLQSYVKDMIYHPFGVEYSLKWAYMSKEKR